MIRNVSPRSRSLFGVVVALLVWVAPWNARAADQPWFDPKAKSEGTAPSEPSSLAPSPLIDNGSGWGSPSAAAPSPEPSADEQDRNPEALTKFRPYLDPYGTWVDDPSYGRVWVPNPSVVGPNFQPYVSNGRWAVDGSGQWIWVSDYSFGWVVFHYGRWVWISSGRWAWIPGNRYAPAWVVWRVPTGQYDYVGWAPAPPSFVWYAGVSFWWGYPPIYPWVFCPSPYLFYYGVGYYVVTDPYWVGYAARNSRPYVPASPHPRTASPQTDYHPGNPTFAAARVPREAVPSGRVVPAGPSGSRMIPNAGAYAPSTAARGDLPARPYTSPAAAPLRPYAPYRPSFGSQRMAPTRLSPSTGRWNSQGAPARGSPLRR